MHCGRGRTNLCDDYATLGLQTNGGLAQFCAVPANTCFGAPAGLGEDAIGLAQPMSIAVHATRRGRVEPGEDVVVIGVGGIGAFISYVAARIGGRVLALDLDPKRLKIATSLGVQHVARAGEVDLPAHLRALGMRPSVIFETSATTQGLDAALAAIDLGGALCWSACRKGRPRSTSAPSACASWR